MTLDQINNVRIRFPIQVVSLMSISLCAFQQQLNSNRVVAILDFANMAAPGVIRLGAHQKSKKYGLGNI